MLINWFLVNVRMLTEKYFPLVNDHLEQCFSKCQLGVFMKNYCPLDDINLSEDWLAL